MGRRFATTIDLKGPFFTKDPTKTFEANIRVLMDAVSREAESDIKAGMQQGERGRRPISLVGGRVSGRVRGRTASLAGKRWKVTAVASVSTQGLGRREAVAVMAAASSVEGRAHAFRRTTGRMRRARALNVVELLKGLQ